MQGFQFGGAPENARDFEPDRQVKVIVAGYSIDPDQQVFGYPLFGSFKIVGIHGFNPCDFSARQV
jgi:hypothetical protein